MTTVNRLPSTSSAFPAAPSSSGTIRCFSLLANIRCQGLSSTQQIGAFAPAGCLAILLIPLLFGAHRYPRAPLFLLAIEITIHLATAAWNLEYYLHPPAVGTFEPADIALACTAATAILAYLLALTAHLLSDLRPHLPHALQSKTALIGYAVVLAPLIPLGLAGGLLGSFVSVEHRHVRGTTALGFLSLETEWLNVVLTSTGIIASMTYILIIFLLAQFVLLHGPSRSSLEGQYRTLLPLWLCTSGILLTALDLALALIPPGTLQRTGSYTIVIVRHAILLVSRTMIAAGLIWAYTTQEAARKRREGIGMGIGGPVRGTFQRLSVGGTREFYAVHAESRRGRQGDVTQGGFGGQNMKQMPERVVVRAPIHRPPALSFISNFSGFNPSPTDRRPAAAAGMVARGRGRSLQYGDSYAQPRDGRGSAPHGDGVEDEKARKNTGSIYAPRRVTVDPMDMAQWPPPVPLSGPGSVPLSGGGKEIGSRGGLCAVATAGHLDRIEELHSREQSVISHHNSSLDRVHPTITEPRAIPAHTHLQPSSSRGHDDFFLHTLQTSPSLASPSSHCSADHRLSPHSPTSPTSSHLLPLFRQVTTRYTADSRSASPAVPPARKVSVRRKPVPSTTADALERNDSTASNASARSRSDTAVKRETDPSLALDPYLVPHRFSTSAPASASASASAAAATTATYATETQAGPPSSYQSPPQRQAPTHAQEISNGPTASPVSSYAGSRSTYYRETLFYATPQPSPCNSPEGFGGGRTGARESDEYLVTSPSSIHERIDRMPAYPLPAARPVGLGMGMGIPHDEIGVHDLGQMWAQTHLRARTHPPDSRTTEETRLQSTSKSHSTDPGVLASLARLRRETGLQIDHSRLSQFSRASYASDASASVPAPRAPIGRSTGATPTSDLALRSIAPTFGRGDGSYAGTATPSPVPPDSAWRGVASEVFGSESYVAPVDDMTGVGGSHGLRVLRESNLRLGQAGAEADFANEYPEPLDALRGRVSIMSDSTCPSSEMSVDSPGSGYRADPSATAVPAFKGEGALRGIHSTMMLPPTSYPVVGAGGGEARGGGGGGGLDVRHSYTLSEMSEISDSSTPLARVRPLVQDGRLAGSAQGQAYPFPPDVEAGRLGRAGRNSVRSSPGNEGIWWMKKPSEGESPLGRIISENQTKQLGGRI